jgi:transposase
MAPNFIGCDREQEFLLPPSLREWLPEDHLAWFVIDAVAAMDLAAFAAVYRVDGHGRPAHDPAMMVALLLYAYAIGERSSRRIERRCVEDVATRVICANRAPDHTTIARFRQRHEAALGDLFGAVLGLCANAGLVRVGVVAIDGTKVNANASPHATRDYEQIAREILEATRRSTRARTSSSASGAATSCRLSLPRARAASGGCATRAGGLTSNAPGRRGPCRGRAPSGCSKPGVDSTRSLRSSAARTPNTRPTERAA